MTTNQQSDIAQAYKFGVFVWSLPANQRFANPIRGATTIGQSIGFEDAQLRAFLSGFTQAMLFDNQTITDI